jgi:CRP-like cAMP-binding protein
MQDAANHTQIENSPIAELFADQTLGVRRANVQAGTVLYDADDQPNNVYFIHRGQVRVYQVNPDGEQRLVEILGPGDWFGVNAFAKTQRHGTRAVAVVTSVVSEVAVDRLLEAAARKPEAILELTRQLAQKVQAARDEAAQLIFADCNSRLIQTLIRFSSSAAATPAEDGVVLRITHHQLAQAVGVARETVSLALTQLRHRKLLRTGRNQLIFKPEVLRQFKNEQNGAARPNGNGTNGHHQQVETAA